MKPKTDDEWRDVIAFIKDNLKDIMRICNQQASSKARDSMDEWDSTLLWYGELADDILKMNPNKMKRLI